MLRFYTHLYALAYLRSERQWGEWADHRWVALMATSFMLLVNVSTVLIALDGLSLLTMPSDKFVFVGLLVAGVLFVRFTIQQSGRGDRLIESLRKSDEQARKRGDRLFLGYLFGSAAIVGILLTALAICVKYGWIHPGTQIQAGP